MGCARPWYQPELFHAFFSNEKKAFYIHMAEDTTSIIIANNIKKIREERGLSQEKLATKAGVHRTYISMIERCQKNVTVSCLEKIALALNIEIVDLLHE